MKELNLLANRFEEHRPRLKVLAYRMLGSSFEAEDAVQESWLRLNRSNSNDIENLGGWLTTVVARVCLNYLHSRKSRREVSLETTEPDSPDSPVYSGESNPAEEILREDSIGSALLVVLETLSPPERVAFVLHDMFDVPFEEVAVIVGRSVPASRQLASRARRRLRGAGDPEEADLSRKQKICDAFLAASREGDFEALLALLDPDVILRADSEAARVGTPKALRGSNAVGSFFKGRAADAEAAVVDGAPAAMWAPGGRPLVVFLFTIVDGRITAIDIVRDPERIGAFTIESRK